MAVMASNNQLLDPNAYLATRQQAALSGQVYNPLIGMVPIRSLNRQYPYNIVYKRLGAPHRGGLEPELYRRPAGEAVRQRQDGFPRWLCSLVRSAEWRAEGDQSPASPGIRANADVPGSIDDGPVPRLFGRQSGERVSRGRRWLHDPHSGIVADGPAADDSGQQHACVSANQPFSSETYNISPTYKPSPNNSWNFTIQREMPGNSVLEIGYIRRTASQLYAPADLNQVPFFMTAGGQTFAQAFDAVAAQLRAGSAVTAQPFFESVLAGSSLCKDPTPLARPAWLPLTAPTSFRSRCAPCGTASSLPSPWGREPRRPRR